jgi:nucleoside-triphosphatase THEP1
VGFRIEAFDGRSDVLAHVSVRSPYKVSKYGVDLAVLDRFVSEELSPEGADVVFIDEIGKMECLSKSFVRKVESLLSSHALLVATVAQRGGALIEAVRAGPTSCSGVSAGQTWTNCKSNRRPISSRNSKRGCASAGDLQP